MLHSLRFRFYNSRLIMCKKMQLVDAQYCLKKYVTKSCLNGIFRLKK